MDTKACENYTVTACDSIQWAGSKFWSTIVRLYYLFIILHSKYPLNYSVLNVAFWEKIFSENFIVTFCIISIIDYISHAFKSFSEYHQKQTSNLLVFYLTSK